ncbi:hypothetical protein [Streptomyces sasae]|nr:hypothetical protein [Streptomyces sasae]
MPILPWLRYDGGYTDAWSSPKKNAKKTAKTAKRVTPKASKRGKSSKRR